ncbi:MAG TPA: FG-GAP-like repeat-containing protein [Nitrospiria bacterium]|nr:FG-GAP-like repeat-containing protein [Nitrospiria bacterium]
MNCRTFLLIGCILLAACGSGSRDTPDPTRLFFDAQGVGTLVLNGEVFGDEFGRSVLWVKDVNGDGQPDLLVGAPSASGGGGTMRGTVYLFYGGLDMDNTPDAVIVGEADLDFFGTSLADAGDVDGDGYEDFWVGAPGQSNSGQLHNGAVYLFRGGPQIKDDLSASSAVQKLTKGASGSGYGTSLATPDLDGDGRPDLIVGAPQAGVNQSGGTVLPQSGFVYLYAGISPTGFASQGQIAGPEAGALFGFSIAGVGHVAGNIAEDFLIGAPSTGSFNPDGTPTGQGCIHTGKAYLYFGKSGLTYAAPDRVMSGLSVGECFGFAVSGGGDLDGDGTPDLAVGAPRTPNGTAYFFLGDSVNSAASGGSVSADLSFSGATLGEFFGASLAPFFDWNGDGLTDFAIGAYSRNRVGGVDLFSGGDPPSGGPVRTYSGSIANGYFGLSLSAGGIKGRSLLIGSPEAGPGSVTIIVF